eukprot:g32199.t1
MGSRDISEQKIACSDVFDASYTSNSTHAFQFLLPHGNIKSRLFWTIFGRYPHFSSEAFFITSSVYDANCIGCYFSDTTEPKVDVEVAPPGPCPGPALLRSQCFKLRR